jgi:hypothetical protein
MLIFAAVLATMLFVTTSAGMQISLWDAWDDFAANPWAVATLYDAYFGFLIFYLWVLWKERKLWRRALWFVLIMGLGNIAMSLYMLLTLWQWREGDSVENLLAGRR